MGDGARSSREERPRSESESGEHVTINVKNSQAAPKKPGAPIQYQLKLSHPLKHLVKTHYNNIYKGRTDNPIALESRVGLDHITVPDFCDPPQ